MDTLLDARRSQPSPSAEAEPRHASMTELPLTRLPRARIPTLVDVSITTRGHAMPNQGLSSAAARNPDVRVSARSVQRLHRMQTSMRNVQRDLLTVAGWGSVAAALGLWVADGGVQTAITSGAKMLVAAGIVTGLVATDLMVVMLVLAARIPFVDRAIGHDRAIALHTKLGKWVLYGLLLHATFLVFGYAAQYSTGIFDEIASLLGISDLLLSLIGLATLSVVAITSIMAVKRSLPYEVWHVIHLTTYAAIGLSLPHQFSVSGLFAVGTWERWYWLALFTIVALGLLSFRFIYPLITSFEHHLVVSRVVLEDADVVSIEMSGRGLDRLGAEAGQFMSWRFLGKGLWWHQHPFSLSAEPTDDTLRITIRALGRGTSKLLAVRPGTRVAVEGPYGIFTDASRSQLGVTLVGIGIGIAPIRSLLEATTVVPGLATVILRAHSPEQLYLVDEIDVLCRAKGVRLLAVVGPRNELSEVPTWLPAQYGTLGIQDLVPYIAESDLYVCGPQRISDLVIEDALAAGTPKGAIHNERFSW
jgi:predicted ferric reductase